MPKTENQTGQRSTLKTTDNTGDRGVRRGANKLRGKRKVKALGDMSWEPYVPGFADARSWYRLLDEVDWLYTDELIAVHAALHREAAEGEFPEHILAAEQAMSRELRMRGIEHRHKDALSEAAGTTVAKPAPFTIEEAWWYLKPVRLHTGMIKLVEDLDEPGTVYLDIDDTLITPQLAQSLLRGIQKMVPDPALLVPMPPNMSTEFVREAPIYDLLMYHRWAEIEVRPGNAKAKSADQASLIPEMLKKTKAALATHEDAEAAISIRTICKAADEHFVLGEVLVPEEEDAHGEIYDAPETRKCCHYWMEHGQGRFAFKHSTQDGQLLFGNEITLLENYIMPADATLTAMDGSKRKVKAGTWMVAARVNDEDIWQKMKNGEIRSWSVGMYCREVIETVHE